MRWVLNKAHFTPILPQGSLLQNKKKHLASLDFIMENIGLISKNTEYKNVQENIGL